MAEADKMEEDKLNTKKEARKAAQQRYNAKIKKEVINCDTCMKQVSAPSWRKHILSEKHRKNVSEPKTFLTEFLQLYKKYHK